MTIEEWVKKNRDTITAYYQMVNGIRTKINDEEREDFVMNYEPLYIMAQKDGVEI
jgi:hypothetical protein